jgi:CheY-like chemotaxis protein
MGLRVLVVEDQPDFADFVVRGLREEGMTVEAAADAVAAWHHLTTAAWDAVLLDRGLPGEDGLSLLKRLRAAVRKAVDQLSAGAEGSWVQERVEGGTWVYDLHLLKGDTSSVIRLAVDGRVIPPSRSEPGARRSADGSWRMRSPAAGEQAGRDRGGRAGRRFHPGCFGQYGRRR